jgi:Domain of unknown function (DUF7014)/AbiJ N-terminal domain 4
MAVVSLFSNRRKAAAKAGQPDVFSYDDLPAPFRVQVAHIWNDLLGHYNRSHDANARWVFMHDAFAREKGVFALTQDHDHQSRCINYLLKCSTDDALDLIELVFRAMDNICEDKPDWHLENLGIALSAHKAIEELNQRFREHGLGYEFANGDIMRVDSQFVHAEAVRPALALLTEPGFEKANEEFMTAHRQYREGHHKESVVAANRAFETTLKTICTKRKWAFAAGDRVSELITVVRSNGLFPQYLDKGFDSYVAAMKTGLPGVRNNAGGHGDEPKAPPVPEYIAQYALHLAASNILLAMEAFKALK